MEARTRLEVFSVALLAAFSASQLVACGGRVAASGGSGGASGGGNAGLAGSAGSGNRFPCNNPVDRGTGLITCDGGLYHHATAVTCVSKVPRPDLYPDSPQAGSCKSDADCVHYPYGWCEAAPGGSDCRFGCITDNDCPANQLCECDDPVGSCLSADCKTDANCAAGFLCKGYYPNGGCGMMQFACQSAADLCGGDDNCETANADLPAVCSFDPSARRFQCAREVVCIDP